MKNKTLLKALPFAAAAFLLTACSPAEYADGVYEAQSSADEDGAYAVVKITLKDNKVTDCVYETYQRSGSLKDESYGRGAAEIGNDGFYEKAQHAVAAMQVYKKQLVQSGSLDGVDKISGATIAYDQFTEAVDLALEKAQR